MKRPYSSSTRSITGSAVHRYTSLAAVWLALLLTCLCCTAVQAQTVTVEYIHTDALGSPVAVTNEAGQVIERTQWEPYGAAIGKPNYDGPGYTGHVMDGATGLTYMQQRYYDPSIGRFLSVDPVTADTATAWNFNRYNYAANNPYKFTDPDGRLPFLVPVAAGAARCAASAPCRIAVTAGTKKAAKWVGAAIAGALGAREGARQANESAEPTESAKEPIPGAVDLGKV